MKIHVFDYPHCCLTPFLQGTPWNIGTNLILPETTAIGLHLRRRQYRWTFIQIFTVSSERCTCFETEYDPSGSSGMTLKGHNGHPRSLIFAPIESAYMTSYSTSIVTLVLSCRVSEILQLLYAENHFLRTPPLFRWKFVGVPLGVDPWRLGCKERTPQANWPWNYFWRIPTCLLYTSDAADE